MGGHRKMKVMIDQRQIQIQNRLGWKIFRILFSKLQRKQFHPSSLSWKKPFHVVLVPNQYAMQIPQVQKSIQITFFLIAKKIENSKTINCSFLPSKKQGFRCSYWFLPVFVKFYEQTGTLNST